MQESDFSDLFNNFLIGCSCIIGTCSWFARSLSLPVSHSIVLSLVAVFSCVFMRWWWFFMIIRTLNLRHLHWGSDAPSIPPIFSGVITFCHSVSPSSSAPISVLSFQSNSSFFPVPLSRRSKNWPPSNTYEWIWPCTFFWLFTKAYWLSVWRNERRDRWEIHRWEGHTLNISHY